MTTYSQKDPRWANLTYDGKSTFAKYGCFVVSLAMMCDKLPTEVADILNKNGLFKDGLLTDKDKAAKLLGLGYYGKLTVDPKIPTPRPDYDCIAETNYWGGQHFFIVKSDGSRIDPLASSKVKDYKVVSYRLFKKEEDMIPRELLTGELVSVKDTGEVLWHVPNAEVFNKYLGQDAWSLVRDSGLVPKSKLDEVEAQSERKVNAKQLLIDELNDKIRNKDTEILNLRETVSSLQNVTTPVIVHEMSEEDKKILSLWGKIKTFFTRGK